MVQHKGLNSLFYSWHVHTPNFLMPRFADTVLSWLSILSNLFKGQVFLFCFASILFLKWNFYLPPDDFSSVLVNSALYTGFGGGCWQHQQVWITMRLFGPPRLLAMDSWPPDYEWHSSHRNATWHRAWGAPKCRRHLLQSCPCWHWTLNVLHDEILDDLVHGHTQGTVHIAN